MGLRFRKSITILPGVKLNLGKTGVSVSAGVRGFRKTFHSSGKVTTSVGIPGTGISYVDTKTRKKKTDNKTTKTTQTKSRTKKQTKTVEPVETVAPVQTTYAPTQTTYAPAQTTYAPAQTTYVPAQTTYAYGYPQSVTQLDTAALQSIHKTCDDSIEWESVAASPVPPNSGYNPQMWEYYHSMAEPVLAGDIDAYLQMIAEVNPLGDLLSYGGNFEFGTDDPRKIEVEFTVNESALFSAKSQLRMAEYNVLLQDYVCSVCIRIARDMFALLPVGHTIVHCVLKNKTIVSVDFDRESLEKVKFGLIDSSETLSMFRNNMSFDEKTGFAEVPVLE